MFQTINSDPTRVAALLSGDIDLIDPVPVQDMARIKEAANTTVLTAPELRTMFLNMDSMRERVDALQREGQQPVQGRARAPRLLSGHRYRDDQDQGDAGHGDAHRR